MKGRKSDRQEGVVEKRDLSGGFSVLSSRIPFRRDQDVVFIQEEGRGGEEVIGVVDGWNNGEKISSDLPGREAASFVAGRYPGAFLALRERSLDRAAQEAAEQVDREFLRRYPAHVASVGVFAFCFPDRTVIVSVGTIHLWTWDGTGWRKPEEIGDYFLTQPPYESGSRTFWGRGELKGDPFYALRVDTVALPGQTPIFMATDGIDDVLALREINQVQEEAGPSFPVFFETVTKQVLSSDKQRDDITLLLGWRP